MIERRILEHQPVGTLVVDRATIVRYANPAAGRMLGVAPDRLVGQAFGLPVVPGGVTDVNVPDQGQEGQARTLALRATELPDSGGSHLISLFDVSGRTRRYEREHRIVEAFQRALLHDRMPRPPGVALAARYVPGEGEIRVGGDWYDALSLSDCRLGLVIGDVAGHGLESAALMSQLRNALRAYALEHDSPAVVLTHMDDLLRRLEPRGAATAIYLTYDLADGRLTYAAAGHPYPLLARPDGSKQFLAGGRSLPLGMGPDDRHDGTLTLTSACTLVLYTDGLVERRTGPIDDGLAALANSIAPGPQDPEGLCDRVLAELLGSAPPMDDVALLVMNTDGQKRT